LYSWKSSCPCCLKCKSFISKKNNFIHLIHQIDLTINGNLRKMSSHLSMFPKTYKCSAKCLLLTLKQLDILLVYLNLIIANIKIIMLLHLLLKQIIRASPGRVRHVPPGRAHVVRRGVIRLAGPARESPEKLRNLHLPGSEHQDNIGCCQGTRARVLPRHAGNRAEKLSQGAVKENKRVHA
jgi:hypothetical protein